MVKEFLVPQWIAWRLCLTFDSSSEETWWPSKQPGSKPTCYSAVCFFFLIFIYLAASDLSYGTRDLCCGIFCCYTRTLVAVPGLSRCGGWNPCPLHQKVDSLATGPPGKSLQCCLNGNKIWPDSTSSTEHIYKYQHKLFFSHWSWWFI